MALTSSMKSFFSGKKAMTSVTSTGLSSDIVQIQPVFETPAGATIVDSKETMLGKRFTILLQFDDAVATSTTAALSVEVKTKDDPDDSTCDRTVAVFGPYSAAEVKGREIRIDVPQNGVMDSLQLVLKTGSDETYTAGNLVTALLVPFM